MISAMRHLTVSLPLLLALTLTGCGREARVQPEVIEGITTAVNGEAAAIGLNDEHTGAFIGGYDVASADGRECLVPLSAGQRVTLGLVRMAPIDDHPGPDLVGWITCLSRPTYTAPR
jgi:hypothetical protein